MSKSKTKEQECPFKECDQKFYPPTKILVDGRKVCHAHHRLLRDLLFLQSGVKVSVLGANEPAASKSGLILPGMKGFSLTERRG